MSICYHQGWGLADWLGLADWEKNRWLSFETQRLSKRLDLLEVIKNSDGKYYIEHYLPIILSVTN